MTSDARLLSPAALRNRAPLRALVTTSLPADGRLVELASGTGEHVTDWAGHLPRARFEPSDPDPLARASCAAWTAALGLGNVAPPRDRDAGDPDWWRAFAPGVDLVIAVNLLHLAAPGVPGVIARGARRLLRPLGLLVLVGPLRDDDEDPRTMALDARLRARTPPLGVPTALDVIGAARAAGLEVANSSRLPPDGGAILRALSFHRR